MLLCRVYFRFHDMSMYSYNKIHRHNNSSIKFQVEGKGPSTVISSRLWHTLVDVTPLHTLFDGGIVIVNLP